MRRANLIACVVLSILVFCGTASATIISGTHQLSNGNYVDLGGLQWLGLHSTSDLPRDCVLNQSYDGYSDWRFATRRETENLLDSLWGGVAEGWHETNFAGADWFAKNFGTSDGAASGRQDAMWFFYGSDADVAAEPGCGCCFYGSIYVNYYTDWWPNDEGWFTDAAGLSTGLTPDNQIEKWPYDNSCQPGEMYCQYPLVSHLLVRETAPIPEPATIMLLGMGIAGAGFARKSKKRSRK